MPSGRQDGSVAEAQQDLPTTSHHPDGQLSINLYTHCSVSFTGPLDPAGWGPHWLLSRGRPSPAKPPLYSVEERHRRDESPWTIVQGVLAPIQFVIFLVSLGLVVRYLATGEGYAIAAASVVVKTVALYAIMITGSIWEREVFGRYLFAPAFFWEDVFSILVLVLHTGYLLVLAFDMANAFDLMLLALAAYAAYVINATQFLLKLRAARREHHGQMELRSTGLRHAQ
jgi:3-vinyl bacteriochlorophyllide hydratase